MERRQPLRPMSAKRAAELAANGVRPWSTLNSGPGLSRNAGLDRKQTPKKRPADTGPTAETVALLFDRDRGCCARCGDPISGERGRDWSVQHRRARGAGGTVRPDTNEPQNLILLCGSATSPGGCHLAVESSKKAARPHGWAIWLNEDPAEVPVNHAVHGWVLLTDDGSISVFSSTNDFTPTTQEVTA